MMESGSVSFREAMAGLGAAVNIVTSTGSGGKLGFTATAVCSVSDAPPQLIVCMNRTSRQNEPLKKNGVLCVNTLAAEQRELSAIFAGLTEFYAEDRFLCANWRELSTGAPVLVDALASFDCVIREIVEAGTHSVFLCEVLAIAARSTGDGLVYFRREYHPVVSPRAALQCG
jgi:flavin reductase